MARARTGCDVSEELAGKRLGFERLRPGQLRAVEALGAGRSVLAVLPTGGGKSAIYELGGLLRAVPTVIVSPLITLQDDQLAHLCAAGQRAIVLNSQQSSGARPALAASSDSDTFVFLLPEQLIGDPTAARSATSSIAAASDTLATTQQYRHSMRGYEAGVIADLSRISAGRLGYLLELDACHVSLWSRRPSGP